MTIAPLAKVTLCGLARDRDRLLADLQALGVMHLLPLAPPPEEPEREIPARPEATLKALRFLVETPEHRRQVTREDGFDVERVTAEVTDLMQRLRDAGDRRDFLRKRIADVEPWGEIRLPPLDDLAGRRLWFYVLPVRHRAALADLALPFLVVHRDHRFLWTVVIAEEEPPRDLLPVPRVHLGSEPLSTLRRRLEDVEILLEELEAEREALTRYVHLLSKHLARAEDRASLAHARQLVLEDDAVVAVQGWVPAGSLGDVQVFAETRRLAFLAEPPAPGDAPPTLLEAPPAYSAGVSLATFYQVPPYGSWDPTRILYWSFVLFFAMIFADAGYGLLLLATVGLYWRRLGESAEGRGWRRLGLALSGATIVYGLLVGSVFGLDPPDGGLLARLHVLRVDDFETMMRISIAIGVVHLALANALIARADGRRFVVVSRAGWIAVLGGGLLLWLAGPETAGGSLGWALLAGGFAAIFAFASDRPLDGPRNLGLRVVDGLTGLAGAMGLFGDVLSYMRLFALGLASASLAVTFNELAGQAHAALPGLGLLVAILILVLGHGLNFALALMSGVVHGLRLNYIEFFKWGLPGEGRPFRRFARKETSE